MIEIKNISRGYSSGNDINAATLRNISLKILTGKITSVVAPAQSGKSLLLKIIAGLETADSGEIVNGDQGKIIYIPSAPSSFPWLNVTDNIKLGLKNPDEKLLHNIILRVGLEGYESFSPDNKSLGFRFRIALARSIAHKPALIILDDPFCRMDDLTRSEVYTLIRDVNKNENITFLIATGKLSEALYLSDKIYLMKKDPAEIISETEIDLPAARDESIYLSERFKFLKNKIEADWRQFNPQQFISI